MNAKKLESDHCIICRLPYEKHGYFGWPTVARLDDGTLMVASSGLRSEHVCPWGKTVLNASRDAGRSWSPPRVINDSPIDDRDAGLVNLGGGRLLVSWFTSDTRIYAREDWIKNWLGADELATWGTTLGAWTDELVNRHLGSWVMLSSDSGATWGAPIRVPVSAPHGPALLADGRLMYLGRPMGPGIDHASQTAEAWQSSDGGRTWELMGKVPPADGARVVNNDEPHVLELPDGRLLGMLRFEFNGDDPAAAAGHVNFRIYQTDSYDGGRTWSVPRSLGFHGSPPHLMRHSSGTLVLTYGYRQAPFGQRVAFSRDDGKSWDHDWIIRDDGPDGDLGYASTVELPDGRMFTACYQKVQGDKKCSLLGSFWRLPWKTDLEFGKQVVVSQTTASSLVWGDWQFPTICPAAPGRLAVLFQRFADNAELPSASMVRRPGAAVSMDGGLSWTQEECPPVEGLFYCTLANGDIIGLMRPAAVDLPLKDIPPSMGDMDNGYNGVYSIRDPETMPAGFRGEWLMLRRRRDAVQWERIPVRLDDPDACFVGYDPPGASHSVMYWDGVPQQVLELPDASLLAIFYGARFDARRRFHPKYQSWCMRSVDGGMTWKFRGLIGPDASPPLAGYTEPVATVLPDGSLLAVLRTECAKVGAMYTSRSGDQGITWSKPEFLYPYGVLPRLLTLSNGVTVLSFGRPGMHLLFSSDGKGRKWDRFTPFVTEAIAGSGIAGEKLGFQRGEDPQNRPKQTRTSGYTDLLAVGPDSLLVAYDQFDYPDASGHPRKTILVRRVTVRNRATNA